jgi:hypothetical protein
MSFASKRGGGTVARDEFFYRVEGPTQTEEDAIMQVESGEIWGRPSRGSDIPSVKAYRGKLPLESAVFSSQLQFSQTVEAELPMRLGGIIHKRLELNCGRAKTARITRSFPLT